MDRNCDAQTFEFKEKPSEAEDIFSRLFPIHKACRDGDVVYLSQLIAESAPDHLIIEDQFKGWTPMHWAAYFGKVRYFCSGFDKRSGPDFPKVQMASIGHTIFN